MVKAGVTGARLNHDLGITLVPYRQALAQERNPMVSMIVLIRAAGEPMALVSRVRVSASLGLIPDLPVIRVDTVEQQLDDLLVNERLLATLAACCSTLSLLPACLGSNGVVASHQRHAERARSELDGVGGNAGRVLCMIPNESLILVLVGIVIGCRRRSPVDGYASRLFGISERPAHVCCGDGPHGWSRRGRWFSSSPPCMPTWISMWSRFPAAK